MAGFCKAPPARDPVWSYDGNTDPCNNQKNDHKCQPDQGIHVVVDKGPGLMWRLSRPTVLLLCLAIHPFK